MALNLWAAPIRESQQISFVVFAVFHSTLLKQEQTCVSIVWPISKISQQALPNRVLSISVVCVDVTTNHPGCTVNVKVRKCFLFVSRRLRVWKRLNWLIVLSCTLNLTLVVFVFVSPFRRKLWTIPPSNKTSLSNSLSITVNVMTVRRNLLLTLGELKSNSVKKLNTRRLSSS